MLVGFRNNAAPKSVEEVDPDHLDANLGPGAEIVSASIEITRDPVTTGIEKVLPWIARMRGVSLDGDRSVAQFSNALSNRLGT